MPIPHPDEVLTVTQITQSIRELLEGNYRFVHIRGEISNLRIPYSGHRYFVLKDSTAQLRAVLFKQQERYLDRPIEDGQQVICHGRISVYEQRGEYQLIVDSVEQAGSGMLQIAFEELKNRLASEGLFDPGRKRPIPAFPESIVMITSPTGAAIHDFLTVWRRRRSVAAIRLLPVRVQGRGAGEEIARAIDTANRLVAADLIVLCRGGGSIEDLWAFNEECVARAIVRSSLPVVTGIGHEIDFTIADFCADLRAPTPTGAAERIIPDGTVLLERIAALHRRLRHSLVRHLAVEERRLAACGKTLAAFPDHLEHLALQLDLIIHRFSRTSDAFLRTREQRLAQLLARLETQTPLHQLQLKGLRLEHLQQRLGRNIAAILHTMESRLAAAAALLHSVSPLATLARGYAIVRKQEATTRQRTVLTDSGEVARGDRVDVLLARGGLSCEVLATTPATTSPAAEERPTPGSTADER
ncbi:MAG: exodeoxyribonuclease VII large subunit [Desulfoprunum sp.]